MAGPWEKYQTGDPRSDPKNWTKAASAPASDGPWSKYAKGDPRSDQKNWQKKAPDPAPAAPEKPPNQMLDNAGAVYQAVTHDIPSGVAGSFGAMQQLGNQAGDFVSGLVGPPSADKQKRLAAEIHAPTPEDVSGVIDKVLPSYHPKTKGAQELETMTGFAPAALAPGGALTKLLRALIPGTAEIAAEENLKGTPLEGAARVLAPLLAGMVAEPGIRRLPTAKSTFNKIPVAPPNAVGSFGANAGAGSPPPTKPERSSVRQAVRGDVMGMFQEGRKTPEGLKEWYETYRKQGIVPLTAQAGGQNTLVRGSTLARMGGETPQLSFDTVNARREQMQKRELSALDAMTGGKSLMDAEQEIKSVRDGLQRQFSPVLTDAAVTPELATEAKRITEGIPEKIRKRIVDAADLQAEADHAEMNEAQALHYFKSALHDEYSDLLASDKGKDRRLGAALEKDWKELQFAMHDENTGIKGLAELDDQYGAAQEALKKAFKEGAKWLQPGESRVRSEAVAKKFNEAPDIVKNAYRVGAHNSMSAKILSASEEKYSPGTLAKSEETRDILRILYGEEPANSFIESNKLIRSDLEELHSLNPRTNSISAPTIFDSIAAESAAGKAISDPKHFIASQLIERFKSPWFKHWRNLEGRDLYSDFTPEKLDAAIEWMMQEDARRKTRGLARVLQTAPALTVPPQDQGNQQ